MRLEQDNTLLKYAPRVIDLRSSRSRPLSERWIATSKSARKFCGACMPIEGLHSSRYTSSGRRVTAFRRSNVPFFNEKGAQKETIQSVERSIKVTSSEKTFQPCARARAIAVVLLPAPDCPERRTFLPVGERRQAASIQRQSL